jgi:hypothetical protein
MTDHCKFLDKNGVTGGTIALVWLARYGCLYGCLKKRLIVCVLARWGRNWSVVCRGFLSGCKSMVSGAALSVTIRLPIL